MAYAARTEVPLERSIGEVVKLLKKAGADRIAQAEEPGQFAIQCFLAERLLRFSIIIPDGPQARRQRGRALLLVIKAKLESIESGVETFEQAFLANVVMPDGKTVAEHTLPRIADAYEGRATMPLLLNAD
jgi:hypothetical protein